MSYDGGYGVSMILPNSQAKGRGTKLIRCMIEEIYVNWVQNSMTCNNSSMMILDRDCNVYLERFQGIVKNQNQNH